MNDLPHPPPSNTHQRDSSRIESLRILAEKADKIGSILSKHKDKQLKMQKKIRIANFVVGGIVMLFGFLSYLPAVKTIVGDLFPAVIAVLAAAFLLAEAYAPNILEDPNPERFGDFARYIKKQARELRVLINDQELSLTDWNARSWLLRDWTETNIDDVLEKWSWVEEQLDASQKNNAQSRQV